MLTAQPKKFMKGRRKGHYCGHCGDGCDVNAMFNSVASTLPIAAATDALPSVPIRLFVTSLQIPKLERHPASLSSIVLRTLKARRLQK